MNQQGFEREEGAAGRMKKKELIYDQIQLIIDRPKTCREFNSTVYLQKIFDWLIKKVKLRGIKR